MPSFRDCDIRVLQCVYTVTLGCFRRIELSPGALTHLLLEADTKHRVIIAADLTHAFTHQSRIPDILVRYWRETPRGRAHLEAVARLVEYTGDDADWYPGVRLPQFKEWQKNRHHQIGVLRKWRSFHASKNSSGDLIPHARPARFPTTRDLIQEIILRRMFPGSYDHGQRVAQAQGSTDNPDRDFVTGITRY